MSARKSRLTSAMKAKAAPAIDELEETASPTDLDATDPSVNEPVEEELPEPAVADEADEAAPEPVAEPKPAPRRTQRAKPVETKAEEPEPEPEPYLVHLRRVIDTGRDQRRYVEDLPKRNDKGTYLRLPVHLQDVLSEYCDPKAAPMADFIASLLDAYFRDIGALPPAGEGNRPVEAFLDELRKSTRTYDY